MQQSIFKDARHFQVIFQCIFLCYGIFFLNWDTDWQLYATYIGTSLALQLSIEIFTKKRYDSWKSALISAFGLCLLLKTNSLYVAAGAAAISILSKYILRFNGKHIFNPSALGIAVAVYFTGNAWISPGQWGSNAVLFFAVISLGFIVVTKVQKLDISIAFLSTFAALLFVRQIIYLGWPMDYFVQSVSTGSLLLFSFFMITDPKTTPNHSLARIVWAMAVAATAFYLTAFKFVNGAPIWVLVLAQPLVPLLDKIFRAKRFEWHSTPKLTMASVAGVLTNHSSQPVAT
jgi:enediyne biosynthesis protein E5